VTGCLRLACSDAARGKPTYNIRDGVQLHLAANKAANNLDILGRKLLRSACVDPTIRPLHLRGDTSARCSCNKSTSSHPWDGHCTQPPGPICRCALSSANKLARPAPLVKTHECAPTTQPLLLACDMQTTRNEPLTATAGARRLPAAREDMMTQGDETPRRINEYIYARLLAAQTQQNSMLTHCQQYNINNNDNGQYAY
jgi:hypothetical protein